MIIGERIRGVRESMNLSQGDIEKRTGLLRCYLSRVENGHTVPALETIEKIARAFEMPLYKLMYDGDKPPEMPTPARNRAEEKLFGTRGKDARYLRKMCQRLSKMSNADRSLLMTTAQKMSSRR